MIEVKINDDVHTMGFTVVGHAGYAESGLDIVCAAVSAVAYTAVLGLQNLGYCDYFQDKDGYMKVYVDLSLHKEESNFRKKLDNTHVIIKTLSLGLRGMQKEYSQYLKVK